MLSALNSFVDALTQSQAAEIQLALPCFWELLSSEQNPSRGGLCSSAWGDLHLRESWAQTGEEHMHGESRIILKPLFQLISLFMQTLRQWCSETLQPMQCQCRTPQGTETAVAREGRDHLHPCPVPWAVLLAATRAERSEPSCMSNKRRSSNQSGRGQPL